MEFLFLRLENINFVVADGKRFAHPLEHLEKSLDDLPVIAIDSFRYFTHDSLYIFRILQTLLHFLQAHVFVPKFRRHVQTG